MYMSCFLMLISIYNVALSAQSIPISFKDTYFCVHTRYTPCEPAQLTGIKPDIGRESPHTSGQVSRADIRSPCGFSPWQLWGSGLIAKEAVALPLEYQTLAPRNKPRRDRYEGHTESDVVYTRVHYCIHVGTLLYTHVYTFPSSIVPLR